MTTSQAQKVLQATLPNVAGQYSEFRGQLRLVIEAESLIEVLRCLKEQANFDQLTDLTVVDHLEMEDAEHRFEVVYCLLDTESGQRLIVKTFLDEPELTLPSVTCLWFGADWLEREAYDMFGIEFRGHPNFKRLLLPQEFTCFPLRKDYPQQGRGERHNFPVITRAES